MRGAALMLSIATLAACKGGAPAEQPVQNDIMVRSEAQQQLFDLNDLDRAVRLTPSDVSLLADRALLLYRQHSYDAARADCDRLLARAPDRADIQGLRADCFSADGDSTAALLDYAEAIEKAAAAPKLAADLLRRRAGLRLDLEDTPGAVRDLPASNEPGHSVARAGHRGPARAPTIPKRASGAPRGPRWTPRRERHPDG